MVLLDTDIMIDFLRGYPPALEFLGSLGADEILLPGFVAMELIMGCRHKREQDEIERNL